MTNYNPEDMVSLIKGSAVEGQFYKISTEELKLIYRQGFELSQNRPYDKEFVNAVAQFKEEIENRNGVKINTTGSKIIGAAMIVGVIVVFLIIGIVTGRLFNILLGGAVGAAVFGIYSFFRKLLRRLR